MCVSGYDGNQVVIASSSYAAPAVLKYGDVVGDNQNWTSSYSTFEFGAYLSWTDSTGDGASYGDSIGKSEGYCGLKFSNGDDTHYAQAKEPFLYTIWQANK
ncbi:MAG: hypothetical protein HRT71_19135 [Flavobacteriales bacterium]|nr:hypothetical protein [Flavobacteriales bacterium]